MKNSQACGVTLFAAFVTDLLLGINARLELGVPAPLAVAAGFSFGVSVTMFFFSLLLQKYNELKKCRGLPVLASDLSDDVYVIRQRVEICHGEAWGAIVTSTRRRPESPIDLRFVWSHEPICERFATGETSDRVMYSLASIPALDDEESSHVA